MQRLRAIALVCCGVAACAWADRGSIPFKPNVKIFEPNQRAMIAWNGTEEILLLSTDLRASEPTQVLEVLPLPSEPVVTKGDVEVFKKATALINAKLAQMAATAKGAERALGGQAAAKPAGEVTFHEKIGAHDISVTKVLDAKGFIAWVETYLKKQGVGSPRISDTMQGLVGEYLKEGFAWFVFDVVALDTTPKTNDAIQYRFKSNCLFYPLKITRTDTGPTAIDLLVLSPRLFSHFFGLPADRVRLQHPPIPITSEELRGLSPDMHKLLGAEAVLQLRIWRIEGDLASFTKDVIASDKAARPVFGDNAGPPAPIAAGG